MDRARRNRDRGGGFRLWPWLLAIAGVGLAVLAIDVGLRARLVMAQMYKPDPVAAKSPAGPGPATRATVVYPAKVQGGEHINVLVMGTDAGGGLTDTMLLASFDPSRHKVAVISIPRDTRTLLAGRGTVEKINGAYAYGVNDKEFPGAYRAMATVHDLLRVPVHYYVTIDLDAFKQMVDDLGGVTMDVPINMNYDDPYQDLHIHLRTGRQKLDGERAMEFVRFRHNNDGSGYPRGDLGRIEAQHAFLKTVVAQLLTVGNLPRLPGLVEDAAKHVQTNMQPSRMLDLASWAVSMHSADITFFTLPGTATMMWDQTEGADLWFFLPDPDATRKLMDEQVLDHAKTATAAGN